MKQFKPVIITAIVLIIVAIAAFATIKLLPEENDAGLVAPGETFDEVTDSPKIIDRSSKDVVSIEITTDTGESFAIDYGEDQTGSQTAAIRNADPLLKYNESRMTMLSGFVGELVAFEEVGTGEDSAFGLSNPRRTIKVNFKDGSTVTLLIGAETPLGDGAYIRRQDRDTIYTVGRSTTEVLMRTRSDYRDFKLFDTIESADLLTSVTVSRKGKKDITVVRKEEGKEPENQTETTSGTDYALISPVSRDANPDVINSALLDKVIAIEGKAVVEDYPKDLKKYGLDNPVALKFKTSNDISASLLIGGKTPEGGRYVMPEGVPTVIATENDIDLEDLNHTDIVVKLLWFYNSQDVDTVTYELAGGETHTMSLKVHDGSLVGTYNGKEMVNKNATNLFLRTVRFTISGEFTSDMKAGERAIKMTIKLRSGAVTTFELFPINERQYAASVDGRAPEYYVNVNEVSELMESFDILARGEDIPDMF